MNYPYPGPQPTFQTVFGNYAGRPGAVISALGEAGGYGTKAKIVSTEIIPLQDDKMSAELFSKTITYLMDSLLDGGVRPWNITWKACIQWVGDIYFVRTCDELLTRYPPDVRVVE